MTHRSYTGDAWETIMLSFFPTPSHGYALVAQGDLLHVAAWSEPIVVGGLSYAQWTGTDWMADEPVVLGARNGWQPSMVVDPTGQAHVVFAEAVVDDLMYGVRVGFDGIDQNCDGVDGIAS
jgi:hypothetical protein